MTKSEYSFDEFIAYGCARGAVTIQGLPWSFKFHDMPVTHENDNCYLISQGHRQLTFCRGDFLERQPDGTWTIVRRLSLDTDRQVFFYEQQFYVLSNFSSFRVEHMGVDYDTAEHAYHAAKFAHPSTNTLRLLIQHSPSAHDAFTLAQAQKSYRRKDWDDVKVGIMREILLAKASRHEYVRRKLLETGNRELIENSWRDDFWGWGPNRDGQNTLGKLWMELRTNFNNSLVYKVTP